MDFYGYSRAAIERVPPHDVPHIIISITSGPSDTVRLRTTDACRGILRLSFPDAIEPSEMYAEESLFSREHAATIWGFVSQHRNAIDRIVVHCDAGVSRSPAVAAALARVLTGDDADFFVGKYRPNMRVYRMLLDAGTPA